MGRASTPQSEPMSASVSGDTRPGPAPICSTPDQAPTVSGAMDPRLLASAFATAASAARPGDPVGAVDWALVGAVAGVVSVGVAGLGIVTAVASARWPHRHAQSGRAPRD